MDMDLGLDDYSMLRQHYLNLQADVTLLTQIAAGQGMSIERAYLDCKERVAAYTKKIEELEKKGPRPK